MSARVFDEKFGVDFLRAVPTAPGVYRYWNAEGEVIYVGKAKNLQRRLRSYRNATRKKVHRKMLRLVKAASRVTFEVVASEKAALILENELIRELAPVFNVDGAYSFLYPAVGVGQSHKQTLLCCTTQPELYEIPALSWYGTFRSRLRARLAFDALVDLLSLIGHREKRTALPPHPVVRGSRLVGLRQIPIDLSESLPWFFAGEDGTFLGELARSLLAKPRARRDASEVQEKLAHLKLFFDTDAVGLRVALRQLDRPGSFIPQQERDAFFIRCRFESVE